MQQPQQASRPSAAQVFQDRPVSGHVFLVERRSGPVWYAKWRGPDGRQVQKRIGPAWTKRGRPAEGHFTERSAQDWLREVMRSAEEAVARAGVVTTRPILFSEAAAEWLRYVTEDRACKATTLRDYRTVVRYHLLPVFGDRRIDAITSADIERWRATLGTSARTKNKVLTQLRAIFKRARRVFGIVNPAADNVEKLRESRYVDLEVFSPEEVLALVRAAQSEQDAAIYLTAAFTGLRLGELIALRWRDVDFAGHVVRVRASYALGAVTTPKSGKVRAVPLAPDVAESLARLSRRTWSTGDEDLVFPGELGGFLCGSALGRRYAKALQRAGLRPLRFHDLRHTFGTRMIGKADIVRVKEWMGHASVSTTMRYLHYMPRPEDAQLVAEAFAVTPAPDAARLLPAA